MSGWRSLALLLPANLCCTLPALAEFAANVDNGAALHKQSCLACHARRSPNNPDAIYTRPGRAVKSAAQLRAQVSACAQRAEASWFPEEEADVAAYLNQHFYRFE